MMEILRIARSLRVFPALRQASDAGSHKGFTLLEMMIVLAILGVLISIAVPSFSQWRAHAAVNDAATAIMGYLKQARNMAMAENRSVKVEFTTPTTYTFDKGNKDPTKLKPPFCAQCKNMTFFLHQYSANLRVITNAKKNTITFSSSGTGTKNSTVMIKDSANPPYCKKIKVNYIGRAYFKLNKPPKGNKPPKVKPCTLP